MYSNMDGGQKGVLFDSLMWCKNKKKPQKVIG